LVLADGGTTFTATQTGSYTVKVTILLNQTDCIHEDTINVTLSSVQTINPVSDYALCDPNGDGFENFDLSTKDSDVLSAAPPSSYTISYHLILADAEANMNPITTDIQNTSNPQVVYVRLENNVSGCFAFPPINLVINPIPSLPTLNPFIVCDDDAIRDQTTALGLTSFDATITNGDANLGVSYHTTQADANSVTNPLASNFSSSSVQLFARIFNINTGCFNTTPIDVEVYNTPELSTDPIFLDACDPNHDGFASFDLETALPSVIASLTGLTASFYTSMTNAQTQTDPIPDPTNYTNTIITEEVVYVRIEDDVSGCFSVRSFEIHTNLLLSETDLRPITFFFFFLDGMHTFSFDYISDLIKNMLLGLTITYYETLADQNNNIPITTPTYTFTGPSLTLFIDIESSTCLEQTEIIFDLIDVVQFGNIPDQRICDTDADGFTMLNLNNFDSAVTGNQPGFQVNYFETLSNADNNVGALPNNYINITNPQTLYVSVTDSATACADTSFFEISVVPAPAINTPSPIIICDNDGDGFSIINLENLIPSLTTSPNSVDFSFFTSLNNANLDIDPITTTTAFDAQTQTLYIRSEENLTTLRCPVITPLSVIVSTLPIIPTIGDYDVCIDTSTNPTFLMNTKDNEIINGQNGKEVFYYEDAGFTQLIDKNQPYIGSNFPQTIYIKVDNITDSTCFSTSSFEINITPFPVYNDTINVDVIGCDTNQIDGKIDIDFNTIINTLTQGITPAPMISFFTTLSNAENNTAALPLNYENTSNPQTLFIRIENSSNGCYLTDSFGINVLSTPNVKQVNNLTQCDTGYDGLGIFNIEDFEIEIFDVRQNFLVATYFDSLQDLENGFPEIQGVTAFQTTSNPQTIYIKVLNTATHCFTSAPLTLTSILPPAINPISEFVICDTISNTFDLSEINTVLTTEMQDITIHYFDSLTNAENELNLITVLNYQSNTTPLFVRIQNTLTNCFYIHNFNFIVNPLPIANQPPDLEDCDDNFDGELEFDISPQTPIILGSQNPSNFTISYYENMVDAESGNSPLNLTLTVLNSKPIIAKIVNNFTQCKNYTSFDIIVNPLPIVDIPKQVICLDNLPLVVSANTFNNGDTYLWSTGQTTSEIIIDVIGAYSVTVTTAKGCMNSTNFEVIISEAATIEFTEVLNFTDPNSITVTIEDGIGDYRYQLDNGPLQTSNFFNNVTLGYHTITVVDLNGCRETTKEVLVINAQKFFTPNNDTYFDTWNIVGIETLPGSVIYIFNRYGKLLINLNHDSGGWNGTYRGYEMPATDYWFLAKIKTPTEQFEYKGHFALKR
jgi:gliding motility-associated-like protein